MLFLGPSRYRWNQLYYGPPYVVARSSYCRVLHSHVLLKRLGRIRNAVLVLHVAAPVVFARKRLAAALLSIRAATDCAVILARLVVLVVYVPIQVRFGAKAPVTLWALMRAFVVASVVTGHRVNKDTEEDGARSVVKDHY